MKQQLISHCILYLFTLLLLVGCKNDRDEQAHLLSDLDISFSCPCELKRDFIDDSLHKEVKDDLLSFKCKDTTNGDKYIFNVLLNTNSEYSKEDIIATIDSALTDKNINHEQRTILSKKGIIIKYSFARELELFDKNKSYYLIVEAYDSLDFKFENCIRTLTIE